MDKVDKFLLLPSSEITPRTFGEHPDLRTKQKAIRRHMRRHGEIKTAEKAVEAIGGRETSVMEFADSRHPEVFIIPRDEHIFVIDDFGDPIGFQQWMFPFSSTDFYVDLDGEGLFHTLTSYEAFWRLSGISQLGYLVPPRPEEWEKDYTIIYLTHQFPHSRGLHSLLVAILMEVILARNDFPQKARIDKVLTAGCHDIAIPAGGDSVKRVDPKELDEEKNFAWSIRHYGLTKKWSEQFGFNLSFAQKMVKNQGLFGRLLDAIDKICYTALDCYHVGRQRPGKIRDFCLTHPLVMDVWQDIKFTADRTEFAFIDAERLFRFLLLRAYEFQELLYNPYSRALDCLLKNLVKPLYEQKVITKKQLLTHNDDWLKMALDHYYPGVLGHFIEPENLSCKKFETAQEQTAFSVEAGNKLSHTEYIGGFNTGLDLLVFDQGRVISLKEVISQDKKEQLEEISRSTKGYYVYYYI